MSIASKLSLAVIHLLATALFTLVVISSNAIAASNLSRCTGEFRKTSWTNCYGVYQFDNGNRYDGEFRNNKAHGIGILYFAANDKLRGNRYEGEFREGKFDGRGKYYTAKGLLYEGGFRDGNQHGSGTAYLPNGKVTEGYWQDGKYAGTTAPATDPASSDQQKNYENTALNSRGNSAVNSNGFIPIAIRPNEQKQHTCDKHGMLKGHKIETTTETIKNGEMHKFYDPVPTRIATSIKTASYEKPFLILELESKALHEEKEGEALITLEKISYEAKPGTTAAATVLTLGIGLIFAPGRTMQSALGCTDETIIKKEVSIQDSKVTGNYEQRNVSSLHEITITGIGEPQKLTLRSSDARDSVIHKIDLTKWVMQAEIFNNSTIIVDCNSCRKQEIEPIIKLSSNNSQARINADLRPLKEEQLAKIKAEKDWLERLEKERQEKALAKFKREEEIRKEEMARKRLQEQEELKRKKLLEEKQQIFNL